jgi:hypothetical protein
MLLEPGELRVWSNARTSITSRNDTTASAASAAAAAARTSSESTIVQPYFLRGILSNPERCNAFVKYCEARYRYASLFRTLHHYLH